MLPDKNYRTYEEFTEYPKSKYYNPFSEWNKSTHKIRFTKEQFEELPEKILRKYSIETGQFKTKYFTDNEIKNFLEKNEISDESITIIFTDEQFTKYKKSIITKVMILENL